MSWRTVVISSHCKLDLKMGCMVIRSEDTKRILPDEVSVIIIENNAVAITVCLINELARRKIAVIFCDEKHNPFSELIPLYGAHDCASNVADHPKGLLWYLRLPKSNFKEWSLFPEHLFLMLLTLMNELFFYRRGLYEIHDCVL